MYKGRRVFRVGKGFTILYVALTMLFAAGTFTVYDSRGWTWVSVGLSIETIERIEESKGSPPAILLKSGRWVKLPSVGSDIGNSVRGWLKR